MLLTIKKNRKNYLHANACFRHLRVLVLFVLIYGTSGLMAQQPSNNNRNGNVQPVVTEPIEPTPEIFYPQHSPQKATMLSATLPGMGQIYNGKYWKVPIIYGGFGLAAYFLRFNNHYYQIYRQAYMAKADGNPNTQPDERFALHPEDRLRSAMNYYRRGVEVTYIAAAALYILNVLDAAVDAHLLDFDVSEDLTLNIQPSVFSYQQPNTGAFNRSAGLKLTFRF
jgi:hypothetical protein